jgi:hypothetical protein
MSQDLQLAAAGTALLEQAVDTEGVELVERSYFALQTALDLTPDGHPDKPRRLSNLGNGFAHCFEVFGEVADVEHAIDAYYRATDLTPDCHPEKPRRLSNLGNFFALRFELFGEVADIEHVIDAYRRATDLTPDGHANKSVYLDNLGHGFGSRRSCAKTRCLMRSNHTRRASCASRALDATQRNGPHPSRSRHTCRAVRARLCSIILRGDVDVSSIHRAAFVQRSIAHLYGMTYERTNELTLASLLAHLNCAVPPDKHGDFDTTEVLRAATVLQARGVLELPR